MIFYEYLNVAKVSTVDAFHDGSDAIVTNDALTL
jgi:hypothetical protein